MVGNPAILTGLKRGSRFGEQNHLPRATGNRLQILSP